jgi:hypothetical protein
MTKALWLQEIRNFAYDPRFVELVNDVVGTTREYETGGNPASEGRSAQGGGATWPSG